MTEQQREDAFLNELLNTRTQPAARPASALTPSDERALLSAANRVGTPTLAPTPAVEEISAAKSFAGEVAEMVRRYPLPVVAFGAGVMFLLARRRR